MNEMKLGNTLQVRERFGPDIRRFRAIETKLNEVRDYLYANSKAVAGYARPFRRGERVGTAHVESTVNQLINWRFCKKQQMA